MLRTGPLTTEDKGADLSFERHLSKHVAWSSLSSRIRPLDLTVMTTFVIKDKSFVKGWLEDIARQRALRFFSVEVVIGCFQDEAYEFMAQRIASSEILHLLGGLSRISVGLFADDPGIYGMWDVIAARNTAGPLLTNWNVDDRKSPQCLRRRINVLNSNATLAAVTAGVWCYSDLQGCGNRCPTVTWNDLGSIPNKMRLFDLNQDRLLRFRDMFEVEWRWEAGSEWNTWPLIGWPYITGSRNVPHNSPMWRRSMHMSLGGFAARDNRRGCYDYSFWLRAMSSGLPQKQNFPFWHINEPLEMYLAREASHGHRTHEYKVKEGDTQEWSNECDPAWVWKANVNRLVRQMWYDRGKFLASKNLSKYGRKYAKKAIAKLRAKERGRCSARRRRGYRCPP
jgi:hypothetical protein